MMSKIACVRHYLRHDFKPLFKYIYDNFIHVYVVIKKIIMNLIKNKNVFMTSILLFVPSVGSSWD